jgi:hypothetical protein
MFSRQQQPAMVVLEDQSGRQSRHCVAPRHLDSTVKRHVDSGAFRAVSVLREGRVPIHHLDPPSAPAARRGAAPAQADVSAASASRSLERDMGQPTMKSTTASMAPQAAEHDAFAAGHGYDSVAATAPIGNAEAHTGRIYAAGVRMPGEGTAWDLRMPDGTTGRATAGHVVRDDWMHQTIASTPDSDFAVVSGRQSDGDGALELASRDAQPGDQVAIVSDRGVITANVTGTEMVHPEGSDHAYHSTVVDQPVVPGWSGSPMVLTNPGDPDQGKVVATATCSNSAESNGVPASVMREAIGGPSAPAEPIRDEAEVDASHQPGRSL